MKFTIFKVSNGYLLNTTVMNKHKSFVFTNQERIKMFAIIDKFLGEDLYDTDDTEQGQDDKS